MKDFSQKVLDEVCTIQRGTTRSYKDIAIAIGSPKSARAVGSILRKNIDPKIPCHRVICSDGSVGSYNGINGKSKTELLYTEGFIVK